mgnify:CR=1 FL=1|tara:strand:- start:4230 stop:4841 length:612 start_codon:yes stop_codon:yes gene_type:complete
MVIAISSNIKKHYKNYCDFLDYYWLDYFTKLKIKFIVLPNSTLSTNYILKNNLKKINLIILPGGNNINEMNKVIRNRNKVEKSIIKFSIKNRIPLLGVCRGMQLINIFFGGKNKIKKNHMGTNHFVSIRNDKIFKKKKFLVNSFHDYCIEKKDIGKNLEIIGECDDQTVEFFKHKKHRIYGIMWHPERYKNYLQLKKIINKIE